MEINFKAKKATIEPQNGYEVLVIVDGYQTKEIIEQLDKYEVLESFGTVEICKQLDHSELLDEMDFEFIKEYLRLNGETEL